LPQISKKTPQMRYLSSASDTCLESDQHGRPFNSELEMRVCRPGDEGKKGSWTQQGGGGGGASPKLRPLLSFTSSSDTEGLILKREMTTFQSAGREKHEKSGMRRRRPTKSGKGGPAQRTEGRKASPLEGDHQPKGTALEIRNRGRDRAFMIAIGCRKAETVHGGEGRSSEKKSGKGRLGFLHCPPQTTTGTFTRFQEASVLSAKMMAETGRPKLKKKRRQGKKMT